MLDNPQPPLRLRPLSYDWSCNRVGLIRCPHRTEALLIALRCNGILSFTYASGRAYVPVDGRGHPAAGRGFDRQARRAVEGGSATAQRRGDSVLRGRRHRPGRLPRGRSGARRVGASRVAAKCRPGAALRGGTRGTRPAAGVLGGSGGRPVRRDAPRSRSATSAAPRSTSGPTRPRSVRTSPARPASTRCCATPSSI